MSSDPGWATWVVPVAQVFGQVIGWLVIVIGWRFISRDNDRRERRKEVRALLTEIRSAILSVEAEAYEYWGMPATGSEKVARKIKRDLKHLAGMVMTLKGLNPKFDLDNLLNKYRQDLTGSDFEGSSRPARPSNDGLFVEISQSAVELTSAMNEFFRQSYS